LQDLHKKSIYFSCLFFLNSSSTVSSCQTRELNSFKDLIDIELSLPNWIFCIHKQDQESNSENHGFFVIHISSSQ